MMYIYGLCDPRDEKIRYVGVTKNLNRRLKEHIQEVKRYRCYRTNWIKSLLSSGVKPSMFVVEEIEDEQRKDKEVYWISYYRSAGAKLTNMTDGGDGNSNMMPETKEKLRIAAKISGFSIPKFGANSPVWGRKHKPEELEKMSVSQAGNRNHRYGKKNTEEHREKISVGNTGKVFTQERRSKISAALTGKHLSLETKEKLRKANLGKTISLEARKKQSEALKGKPKSPEHIAALKAAWLRRKST